MLNQPNPAGILGAAALALSVVSCGDACEELQTICDRCQDVNQKYSCEEFVDRDVQESCENTIDDFSIICK